MPYAYTLISWIPATARDVYDTWLDSTGHSAMTGAGAVMSDEVGAEVSAWDGYIGGRNIELVPGQRIVQSWRTTKFSDEHADSVITVTLEDADGGTLLTLVHSNVPDEQRNYEEGGWESNYFEPMKRHFGGGRGADEASPPNSAAKPKAKAKAKAKAAKKPKSKSKSKPRAAVPKAAKKPKARKSKAKKLKAKRKPAKKMPAKSKSKSRRGRRK